MRGFGLTRLERPRGAGPAGETRSSRQDRTLSAAARGSATTRRRRGRRLPSWHPMARCQTVTPDEWMDLIYEAHVAVVEQAFLFEVVRGSTEVRDGREVRYGPWDPEACSTVLTTWFDLGWIRVYMPSEQAERWAMQPAAWMAGLTRGHHPMLRELEARELLATPSSWREDRSEGWAALLATDSAPIADLNVWFRDIPIPAS